MSLINQVLRDLDQRQAGGTAMPAAVKAPPAPHRHRPRIALAALAAVTVGGVGALTWTLGAHSAQPHAAATAAVAVPVSPPAPTPVVVVQTPTPVVIAAAASPASAATPATTRATAVRDTTRAVATSVDDTRTSRTDAWPARTLVGPITAPAAASTLVATAPVASPKPTADAPAPEPRIEKRAPTRTAHERAEAAYQRGIAAHQQAQLADASSAYAAALREEPAFAPARQALAGVLIAQGRADDARALLAEGLALAPRQPGLAMMLARLHAERGQLQQAADVLQAAAIVSASPEDRAFHAAILQKLDRHSEAAELFAAALRVTPTNGVWWMGLGMSLAADGRNDTAREAFSRARATGTLSPELAQYVEQRIRQLL